MNAHRQSRRALAVTVDLAVMVDLAETVATAVTADSAVMAGLVVMVDLAVTAASAVMAGLAVTVDFGVRVGKKRKHRRGRLVPTVL